MLSVELTSGELKLTKDTYGRFIVEDEPRAGAWNMAADEVLLESALHENVCTLRWYRWREATVSLGYFQPPLAVPNGNGPHTIESLPQVRRLSGGGAILHHHEWTYSLAIPPTHVFSAHPEKLYGRVHAHLIDWMNRQGLAARLRNEAFDKKWEPFLCFGRGDPNDIVVDNHKVVGSAQRRRRGAILQHGSVLMTRSEYAPQFPGLLDLGLRETPCEASINELAGSMSVELLGQADVGSFTEAEFLRIHELIATRYGSLEWTFPHSR
ncbi:MAG: biotin/lipoate A/B protein ligase family protein [Planctomycetaceae bacterium]